MGISFPKTRSGHRNKIVIIVIVIWKVKFYSSFLKWKSPEDRAGAGISSVQYLVFLSFMGIWESTLPSPLAFSQGHLDPGQ